MPELPAPAPAAGAGAPSWALGRWGALDTRRSIGWLGQASDDPQQFRMIWSDDPRRPQLVSAGELFDVVVTDRQVGIETLAQLRRRVMPAGAVTVDRAAGCIGFMVPPGTRASSNGPLRRRRRCPRGTPTWAMPRMSSCPAASRCPATASNG
jgi:hypothetical protein